MKVVKATTSIEEIEGLKEVALEWRDTCNGKDFGLELDIDLHLSDLAGLVKKDDADLFILLNDENIITGYMGVISFNSPIGSQRIAEEHMWFVSRNNRGRGTILLIRAAKEWAKGHGCSHIIYNASMLASDMHNKLCRFYERIGFKKFDTSFILKL